jgi:hypothetical protein
MIFPDLARSKPSQGISHMALQTTLRLLIGDQLNIHHSWFRRRDDGVTYNWKERLNEIRIDSGNTHSPTQ